MLPNKFQKEFSSPPFGESEGVCKVLIIGHVWPEPTTTAAGNRMLQLLEAFLSKNYQVTFASTASKTKYAHDLTTMGIKEQQIQLNDTSFDIFVKALKPEIVVFDRFMVEEQFGWRVVESCPNAVRILNTEDLHSLREFRETCVKNDLEFSISGYLQQDKTKREMASIYRSDLTLLVSSFEKELLENEVGIHKNLLLHLPFMFPKIGETIKESWPSFEERQDFISFGNGRHAPNIDSFRYMKETIWPLIRKELPKAQLHIYGAYLPQQIIQMHQPETGILVHGWVEHLEKEVRKARVVLAPLRFGAGIKGKLAMAMQNGTPNVTTTTGAEGMSANHSWSGCVEDGPEAFVMQSVELYHNRDLWYKSQKNGVDIINSNYGREIWTTTFFERIEGLLQNLESHRNKNVIGSLLRHQTLAATKYMGKWIEEKNKFKK